MLAQTFVATVNHLLAGADWARRKLGPHAGKVAAFNVFPARFAVEVSADGTLAATAADAPAAVTIRLTHLNLLELLAGGDNAWRSAEVEGDAEFAAAISQVAANLRWDAEEDLSRVVGDIAAHRLAGAGHAAAAWPRQAARSMAENAAEYLTEESKLLVTPLQASEFVREVDELRDATERLEKRIERLVRLNAGT